MLRSTLALAASPYRPLLPRARLAERLPREVELLARELLLRALELLPREPLLRAVRERRVVEVLRVFALLLLRIAMSRAQQFPCP